MFGLQEIFGMFPGSRFRREYKCYSIAMLPNSDRPEVDKGGKIILPPSALHILSQMNVQFPMLFRLKNAAKNTVTHCGVLEFIAEEGLCFLPSWMMRNLLIQEGDILTVESVNLPVASYSKFQPQSVDFLDITDPRAVLESTLRGVACLTVGDVIAIEYNSKIFELLVLETKPSHAVSIIECDMQVDFAAPVGYQEPERVFKKPAVVEEEPMMIDADVLPDAQKFSAFTGSGLRLGGNKKKGGASLPVATEPIKRQVDVASLGRKGVPNYDWKPGRLTFRRNIRKPTVSESESVTSFSAFSGEGHSLKKSTAGKN